MGGTFLLGEKRKVNVFEHRSLLNNLKQASIRTEVFLLFENHYFHGNKGPLILLCRIISVECPTNLNFLLLTSNQNKVSPKQPISMRRGSKSVGHSSDIIQQSKIKGPLKSIRSTSR